MGLNDEGISANYSFGLEVDGVVIKQIAEISGLKLERDFIELKQNTADGKYVIKRVPGRTKPGEITFVRNLAKDSGFDGWIRQTTLGGEGRQADATIFVYDVAGVEMRRFNLENVWARSLEIAAREFAGSSVLVEKLTLSFEGVADSPDG